MKKLILAALAAFALCPGARADSTHAKVQLWAGGPYWATTNIGADEPWDYGYYFWWGDTVGYKRESDAWVASDGSNSNFSFNSANVTTRGKSVADLLGEGWITANGVLASEHDAAQAHWGGVWRMPTNQELSDLISNCNWTWTTTNSVSGYIVCGKGVYSSNRIFIPASGLGGLSSATSFSRAGSYGYIWSSVPNSDGAWSLDFGSSHHETYKEERHYGFSVRPVWQTAQEVNLSTKTDAYTAQDGDVLMGATTKYTVSIPHGATVMLSNVTIERTWQYSPSIICLGDATILLADGTVNTLVGTLQVGGAGTTLIIEGKTGELVATGNGSSAGIGAVSGTACGNIVINGGVITATGTASNGYGGAGIGAGRSAGCGNITINGGTITATAGGSAAGIGGTGYYGSCGDIAISAAITRVVATRNGSYGANPIQGNTVSIHDDLLQTGDAASWTLEPIYKYHITWLDDDGTEIDTTLVSGNAIPSHADPTKAADVPYRWVFTGWTPELEAAVSNTTYTATFKKVADLALCTNDWTAADGDEIVGETAHEVSIPGGAHVTINGVAVTGIGGGGSAPAPAFAAGCEAVSTKFAQGAGDTWTITAFAELANDAVGADVADGRVKVYRGDTADGVTNAVVPTITEKKSAVKVEMTVEAPSGAAAQFFKVGFE